MPACARESIQLGVCARDASRSASAIPGDIAVDNRPRRLRGDVAWRDARPARGQDRLADGAVGETARSVSSISPCSSAITSRATTSNPSEVAKRPAARAALVARPLRRPRVADRMSAARPAPLGFPPPVVAPTALLEQGDLVDLDAAFEPLDHVVDRQTPPPRTRSSPPSRRPSGRTRPRLGDRARPALGRRRRRRRRRRRSSPAGCASGISSAVRFAACASRRGARRPAPRPWGRARARRRGRCRATSAAGPRARAILAVGWPCGRRRPSVPVRLVDVRQAPSTHALAPEPRVPRTRAPGAGVPGTAG